jgi:lipase
VAGTLTYAASLWSGGRRGGVSGEMANEPVVDGPAELVVHAFGREDRTAPALILLHGITDSGSCWGDAVERWSERYRIAAIDALGHGRSPRFTDAQLVMEPAEHMYAATVAAIERIEAGTGPAILVGHSMGGAMATAVTARRPDLVRAAVLEDPAWPLPDDPLRDDEAMHQAWVVDRQRFIDDPEGALARGRREHPTWPERELGAWAQAKRDTDPAFLAAGAVFVGDPWPELVARISRPTLVVTGTDGTIIGRSRPVVDAIANPVVEIAVIDGAGHCVRRDRGHAFHAVVDPWIADRCAEGSEA